jgi:hypothetical protein
VREGDLKADEELLAHVSLLFPLDEAVEIPDVDLKAPSQPHDRQFARPDEPPEAVGADFVRAR